IYGREIVAESWISGLFAGRNIFDDLAGWQAVRSCNEAASGISADENDAYPPHLRSSRASGQKITDRARNRTEDRTVSQQRHGEKKEHIRSVERAIDVLQALNRRPLSTLHDLHSDTGLPKPSIVRLLRT